MKRAALLLSLVAPTPLAAQSVPTDYNAETMLKLCRGAADGDPDMQSMICTFRIQGVAAITGENCLSKDQGYEPHEALASAPPPSRGSARQAFTNYMDANPDAWGLPWHIAVSLALSDAFPCME